MSKHEYEYVECNGCGAEARTEGAGPFTRNQAPAGWLHVTNRLHANLWDMCPACAKAFTVWILRRNGIEVDESKPLNVDEARS